MSGGYHPADCLAPRLLAYCRLSDAFFQALPCFSQELPLVVVPHAHASTQHSGQTGRPTSTVVCQTSGASAISGGYRAYVAEKKRQTAFFRSLWTAMLAASGQGTGKSM